MVGAGEGEAKRSRSREYHDLVRSPGRVRRLGSWGGTGVRGRVWDLCSDAKSYEAHVVCVSGACEGGINTLRHSSGIYPVAGAIEFFFFLLPHVARREIRIF